MNGLMGNTRRMIQFGFLVAVVIVTALGLGQKSESVSASHTEIIFSYSNTSPTPAPVIVLQPGVPKAIYVWAVGVDDPTGVSGFQVDVTFNSDVLNVFQFQPETAWLGSTGRSVSCFPLPVLPGIDESFMTLSCNTLIGPGYIAGPSCSNGNCDGLIATIGLNPTSIPGQASSLDLRAYGSSNGTYLLNTPTNLDVTFLTPLTLQNSLVFLKCGDVTGDGVVDLFNDIIGVIQRFGMSESDPTTWPEGLVWSWAFDMNEDGEIDLFNDIVAVIQQFGVSCTQV